MVQFDLTGHGVVISIRRGESPLVNRWHFFRLDGRLCTGIDRYTDRQTGFFILSVCLHSAILMVHRPLGDESNSFDKKRGKVRCKKMKICFRSVK